MNQEATARQKGCETLVYELHGNLYLNITNRCSLRCTYCPKFNHTWTVQDYALRLSSEPDTGQILKQIERPESYKQIVFCGLGEPTTRLDTVLDISRALKKRGATIRLNTDGLANLVHGRDVTTALAECVDEVSVSMNAQNTELYTQHCRPKQAYSYEYMLEFVRKLHSRKKGVTLTAIDGLQGVDILQCQKMADAMGVNFRRRTLGLVG